LVCTLYYVADNTTMFYKNDKYVNSQMGEIGFPTAYVSIPMVILATETIKLSWVATNWGGPAGLIYSLMDEDGTTIYLHSDESTQTREPEWYLANVVNKPEQRIEGSIVRFTEDVFYGLPCRVLVDKASGSEIAEFMTTDLEGLSLSSDKLALVTPTVTFTNVLEVMMKMKSGITIEVSILPRILHKMVVNDYAPVSANLYYIAVATATISITLEAKNTTKPLNDPTMWFSIVDIPKRGVLSGTVPNLVYTANPDFIAEVDASTAKTGIDKFTYIAQNELSRSEVATVTIEVTTL